LAGYNRAVEFCKANGQKYGYSSSWGELETEDKTALSKIYNSDPSCSSQGPIELDKPQSLSLGRLKIELFSDCPKTVENFKCLITGEKGMSKKKKEKKLHYKGNRFHRIIDNYIAQAGDVTHGNGSGGESIYKGFTFPDEKPGLSRKFDEKGLVGMANSGKNSNTSQFFITLTKDCPKLHGNYVCFGRVVEGLEILDTISKVGTKEGVPTDSVIIADCGML